MASHFWDSQDPYAIETQNPFAILEGSSSSEANSSSMQVNISRRDLGQHGLGELFQYIEQRPEKLC